MTLNRKEDILGPSKCGFEIHATIILKEKMVDDKFSTNSPLTQHGEIHGNLTTSANYAIVFWATVLGRCFVAHK